MRSGLTASISVLKVAATCIKNIVAFTASNVYNTGFNSLPVGCCAGLLFVKPTLCKLLHAKRLSNKILEKPS